MNDVVKNNGSIEAFVMDTLANILGVVPEDISEDDSLKEDLHMSSSEITDFMQKLENQGFKIDLSKITQIDTVSDVIEIISEEVEF